MYKKGEFSNYVEGIKKCVDEGLCTKEEAVKLTLAKAMQILADLKVEHMRTYDEQFMDDQKLNAQEVN